MPGPSSDYTKRVRLVLYAEDDPSDVFFFDRATKQFDGQLDIRTVPDGSVAIGWLNGDGPYADRKMFPLPDILITDLKMPRQDGFDVLRFIRKHPQLKELPVIVYSSSCMDVDVARARDLKVTDFIEKDAFCNGLVKYLRQYLDGSSAPAFK